MKILFLVLLTTSTFAFEKCPPFIQITSADIYRYDLRDTAYNVSAKTQNIVVDELYSTLGKFLDLKKTDTAENVTSLSIGCDYTSRDSRVGIRLTRDGSIKINSKLYAPRMGSWKDEVAGVEVRSTYEKEDSYLKVGVAKIYSKYDEIQSFGTDWVQFDGMMSFEIRYKK